MTIDPTDSVRALLEQATSPMSTEQIADALTNVHSKHEVEQALDFWRRERHDAVEDADGKWSWQAQGPRSA